MLREGAKTPKGEQCENEKGGGGIYNPPHPRVKSNTSKDPGLEVVGRRVGEGSQSANIKGTIKALEFLFLLAFIKKGHIFFCTGLLHMSIG